MKNKPTQKEPLIWGRAMDGHTTWKCVCGDVVRDEDMTKFNGKFMCAGCAETADLFEHDDPHGRNWRNE